MIAFGLGQLGRTAIFVSSLLAASAAFAQQQTSIKFSLDFKFEGPAAPFVVAIDKGYFKAEGLDVTIDTAAGSLEPINRVASGTYDMGFGDINSLIKFRDANPGTPIKAVFMVYNKPAFYIVTRKSRGVMKPNDLEGKVLGAPAADSAYAQWKIFEQNGLDVESIQMRSQAANAANDEQDRNTRLGSAIKRIDDLAINQGIHLRPDRGFASGLGVGDLRRDPFE